MVIPFEIQQKKNLKGFFLSIENFLFINLILTLKSELDLICREGTYQKPMLEI